MNKKPITLPLPKCAKCGKTLELQFTTEKEEGDDSKPEVLILFGTCEDCNTRTVCNMIKTEDIPNEKELIEFASKQEGVQE